MNGEDDMDPYECLEMEDAPAIAIDGMSAEPEKKLTGKAARKAEAEKAKAKSGFFSFFGW